MSAKNTKAGEAARGPEAGTGSNPSPPPADDPSKAPEPKAKKVRVIVEKGTLGPLLLVKGDETDDPEYVALLEVKGQKKVEAVR